MIEIVNTVSFIRSECIAETPLMLCEPTKASCPSHPAAGFLVDQRHRGAEVDVAGAAHIGERQMSDIDAVDDFQVARQQPFEQFDRQVSSASGDSVWLV